VLAHQVVVEDELVARGGEQVRSRVLHSDPDHDLVVLAQLRDTGREIRIAAQDGEGVDVRLGVAQVERVHHHANVGRVLARLAHVGNLDHLEGGLVHGALEIAAVPVAVRLLDHDAALEQQTLQHAADVELRVGDSLTPIAMFSKSQKTAMLAVRSRSFFSGMKTSGLGGIGARAVG
jgi:hypothetical protein